MPAYFVAELETTNQAGMDPYRAAVPAPQLRNMEAAT